MESILLKEGNEKGGEKRGDWPLEIGIKEERKRKEKERDKDSETEIEGQAKREYEG